VNTTKKRQRRNNMNSKHNHLTLNMIITLLLSVRCFAIIHLENKSQSQFGDKCVLFHSQNIKETNNHIRLQCDTKYVGIFYNNNNLDFSRNFWPDVHYSIQEPCSNAIFNTFIGCNPCTAKLDHDNEMISVEVLGVRLMLFKSKGIEFHYLDELYKTREKLNCMF